MASPIQTRCSRSTADVSLCGTASAWCSTSTPKSVDEALEKAGLGWKVSHGDVLVVKRPEWINDFGTKHAPELITAKGFKSNVREDTDDVLGIVSDDYEVVENADAFRFLDALINADMHFETAGSLWGGRRVWVLARLPEYVELGGDLSATYLYVANSHDGSMAVIAAVTPIRTVCANTLSAALRQAEQGVNAQRTFRFRHIGNLQAKFADARQVLGMTIKLPAAVQGASRPDGHRADRRLGAGAPRAAASMDDRRGRPQARPLEPGADDRGSTRQLPRPGCCRRRDRQQPGYEVGRVQRDRRARRPWTALHQADQPGPALL
jgi:hypothetical protein